MRGVGCEEEDLVSRQYYHYPFWFLAARTCWSDGSCHGKRALSAGTRESKGNMLVIFLHGWHQKALFQFTFRLNIPTVVPVGDAKGSLAARGQGATGQ